MGTIKVVIDTNVVVSALLFGGIPKKIVAFWQSGKIKPVTSKDIIEEYIRVLTYPEFKLSEEEINFLLYTEILPYFDVIDTRTGPPIIKQDPADDNFLRCAIAAGAEYVISGNRHLLALEVYQEIKILSQVDFINRLTS